MIRTKAYVEAACCLKISTNILKTFMSSNFRFKYFVALSDFSSQKWPSEEAKDHILFKGLQKVDII